MTLTPEQASALYQSRQGGEAKGLLSIYANRDSDGQDVWLGFWGGVEDQDFTIDSVPRTFWGFGEAIDFGILEYEKGLLVNQHTVTLNGAAQEARSLVRDYDFRYAQAEIHLAHFDPLTGAFLGIDRKWKGYVDQAPEAIGENRGPISLSVAIVSSVRDLTITPNLMKSNAAQEELSGDKFRRDSTMTDQTDDPWAPN